MGEMMARVRAYFGSMHPVLAVVLLGCFVTFIATNGTDGAVQLGRVAAIGLVLGALYGFVVTVVRRVRSGTP